MKELDNEQFTRRMEEVMKARRIFTPHITNDISVAFEIYQEVLAEEKLDKLYSKDDVSDELCPMCNKNLKYKRPCCGDKNSYLVCACGYKRIL